MRKQLLIRSKTLAFTVINKQSIFMLITIDINTINIYKKYLTFNRNSFT